jgi:hypothetical protein
MVVVLLIDRLLDWLAAREQRVITTQRSLSGSERSTPIDEDTGLSSHHSGHGELGPIDQNSNRADLH